MLLSHFPAFKHRDFRLLWISELISAIGTSILTVALSWQLYLLTHSAIALGLVGLAQGIPFLLFNLIGGSFADAHNRKVILYITQPIIALASFILAVTTFTHTITPLTIYSLLIVVNLALAFDMPARGGLMPTLVPKKDLGSANSIYTLLWQTSNMIGPAIGGFLIAGIGVGWIYMLDAFSTVSVVLAIMLIHASGVPHGDVTKPSFRAIQDGFSFLFSRPILWSTKLLDAVSVLFASSIIVMPIFAKDILHVGPQGLGFLYAAPSIGGVVVGFLVSPHLSKVKKQGKLLLISVAIYALATVYFGFSTSFIMSLLALFIAGGANVISVILRSTITQLNTPNHMMGRLSSISSVFWFAGDKLGDVEGGFLAQLLGARLSVVLGGIGALVTVGVMTLGISSLRNYTDDTIKENNLY